LSPVRLPGGDVSEPRSDRPPIILQLDLDDFAVAVWMRDEEGEPIHTIRHRGIRDAKIAATLAAQKTRADMRREPDESPGRGQDEPSPGDRPNARKKARTRRR
jgi:hypothetical protein